MASAELYDPANETFSPTGSLGTTRHNHTATLLPNGKVLIVGGVSGFGNVTSVELYDMAEGTFTGAGDPAIARRHHTATLLLNGQVLIAGGFDDDGMRLSSAERFDPVTATFSATGSLGSGRAVQSATLLSNGRVLVAGEPGSAEVYDAGLGFSEARRPRIGTAPTLLGLPATVTILGSGFLGDSEASSGGTNNSATNHPLVQLQRLDNDQTFFAMPNAPYTAVSWSAALDGLPGGWYRATVFTNGIPSTQRLIAIWNAPAAVTLAATTITSMTATLRGTVNPNGSHTTAAFDYGETLLYGSTVSATPVPGAGTVPVTVTAVIGGLTCNTSYHVRAVGANAIRTNGNDLPFTTAPCPTVVTLDPTNVTAAAVTLHAEVNPGGLTSVLYFEYGTAGYDSIATFGAVEPIVTAVIKSLPVSGLRCGTLYKYRAVLQHGPAAGITITGADRVFTTRSCPGQPFTDDALTGGASVIRAVHLIELRTRIDALRARFALGAFAWTDPSLIGLPMSTVHVTEMRTALQEAYVAAKQPSPAFSDPNLVARSTLIRVAHLHELRSAVLVLEGI